MRFLALALCGLGVGVVALAVYGFDGARDGATRRLTAGASLSLPEVRPVSAADRQLVIRARQGMAGLRGRLERGLSEDSGSLLARAPAAEPQTPATPQVNRKERRARLPERLLTMIVWRGGGDAPGRSVAMIDGLLVGVGEALPKGGVVHRIEEESVLVRERDGRWQRLRP